MSLASQHMQQASRWPQLVSPLVCLVSRSGMDELGLTAYAAGLLGEYLAQHWQDKLAAVSGWVLATCELCACGCQLPSSTSRATWWQ